MANVESMMQELQQKWEEDCVFFSAILSKVQQRSEENCATLTALLQTIQQRSDEHRQRAEAATTTVRTEVTTETPQEKEEDADNSNGDSFTRGRRANASSGSPCAFATITAKPPPLLAAVFPWNCTEKSLVLEWTAEEDKAEVSRSSGGDHSRAVIATTATIMEAAAPAVCTVVSAAAASYIPKGAAAKLEVQRAESQVTLGCSVFDLMG